MRLVANNLLLTHTISIPEVVWTTICLLGFLYSLRLLTRAINDLRWLRAEKLNGIREYSAKTTILTFVVFSTSQFSYVLIGAIAMAFSSPQGNISNLSWIVTVVFIITSVLFDVGAWYLYRRKENLIDMIRKERGGTR